MAGNKKVKVYDRTEGKIVKIPVRKVCRNPDRYISRNKIPMTAEAERATEKPIRLSSFRVFICHEWWSHTDCYFQIVSQLQESQGIAICDLSIPQTRPVSGDHDAIRATISSRIRSVDAVIAVIDPPGRLSEWVAWEVTEAQSQHKRIYGVVPVGVSPDEDCASKFDEVLYLDEDHIGQSILGADK